MKGKPKVKVFVAKTNDSEFHKHVHVWAKQNDISIQELITEFLDRHTGYCNKGLKIEGVKS